MEGVRSRGPQALDLEIHSPSLYLIIYGEVGRLNMARVSWLLGSRAAHLFQKAPAAITCLISLNRGFKKCWHVLSNFAGVDLPLT